MHFVVNEMTETALKEQVYKIYFLSISSLSRPPSIRFGLFKMNKVSVNKWINNFFLGHIIPFFVRRLKIV